jgi:hypothetical protein
MASFHCEAAHYLSVFLAPGEQKEKAGWESYKGFSWGVK